MKTKLLKKIVLVLTIFLFQFQVSAQMFVGPNSYVFANNEVVYIKQNLELQAATSIFYLRDKAQLLQGSTATSTNSGLGSLSILQEGSTNNFHYNYWCSPVGRNIAGVGNSQFGITQLKDVTGVTTFNEPIILPNNNYNGTSSPLAIAPFWINKLIATSSYSSWIQVGANSTLNAGEGFTMKGTSGISTNNPTGRSQQYDFRGKPNDGTILIPVKPAQFTLTGNPYPSAIDLSAFLAEQTNCTGIAYFWEQDATVNSHFIADYKGGYGTFAPGSLGSVGIYTPATFYSYDGAGNQIANTGMGGVYQRRFVPVGQGFLIAGNGNGFIEMKNSYRIFVKETPGSSTVLRTTSSKNKIQSVNMDQMQSISGFDYTTVNVTPTPQIRFNTLMDNKGVRQLVLASIPEATDGVDRGMDALSSGDASQADVYFVIDNSEFVINTVNFDVNKKIPLGFKNTNAANFKITVKEIINFTDVNSVYLHDKVNNTYHDIKNDFYELELIAGQNNTQFEITFKTENSLAVEEATAKNFLIFQDNSAKSLVINNPFLKEINTCGFYDVAGKLIFIKNDLGAASTYQFSTAGLGDGIYIAKIMTKEKETFGKKVIVKN
jgi:hypothetical protein